MFSIYEYRLPYKNHFTLSLPENCKILCVKVKDNVPFLYIAADSNNIEYCYSFRLALTYENIDFSTERYIDALVIDQHTFFLFEAL